MPTLIRFHRTGGPEVLQYDEVLARPLQAGEIRLKVEAIDLDRAEIMFRDGRSSPSFARQRPNRQTSSSMARCLPIPRRFPSSLRWERTLPSAPISSD